MTTRNDTRSINIRNRHIGCSCNCECLRDGSCHTHGTVDPKDCPVMKLRTVDLSKRYGNLKAGPDDIIKSKWFSSYSWDKLMAKQVPAPYKPQMKNEQDVSNFEDIPDSAELPPIVPAAADPFSDW